MMEWDLKIINDKYEGIRAFVFIFKVKEFFLLIFGW